MSDQNERPIERDPFEALIDTNTEQAFLGCLIIDETAIHEVIDQIRADDFYDDGNRKLFELLVEAREDGVATTNMVAILKRIKDQGLGNFGIDGKFLAKLANIVPNAANAVGFAIDLIELSRKRDLYELSNTITRKALSGNHTAVETIGQAYKVLSDIEARASIEVKTFKEACVDALTQLRTRSEDGGKKGMAIGIPRFDEHEGGIVKGRLMTIAARPGGGKTALGMQIVSNLAVDGFKTLVVSLEMTSTELAERHLSGCPNVDPKRIKDGTLDEYDWHTLEAHVEGSNYPIYIYSPPRASIRQIMAAVRSMIQKHKIDVVLIDYLQIIEGEDSRMDSSNRITSNMRVIDKEMAEQLDLAVILLCQLNREGKGKKPTLGELKGSGSIEQDSDVVMTIHNEGEEDERLLSVLKYRQGGQFDIPMRWDGATTTFEQKYMYEDT